MTQPNARVTDAEKCKLIAERLEGWHAHGGAIDDGPYPEYMRFLDATMRAARNLPQFYRFEIEIVIEGANSWAAICDDQGKTVASHWDNSADPARAAFEALAAYLLT